MYNLGVYINGWQRESIAPWQNPFMPFEFELSPLVEERLNHADRASLEALSKDAAAKVPEGYSELAFPEDFTDEQLRSRITTIHLNYLNSEITGLSTRLRIKNSDLYDDYDRVSTESDLRTSLTLPILALSVALAARWSPWFIGLAVICPIIWAHGRQIRARANKIIVGALVERVMTAPTLDYIDKVIQDTGYRPLIGKRGSTGS
jgi:hypothetical protein